MVVSLKSIMDNENRQHINIFVTNPVVHYTWDNGHYTSYAIHIETKHITFTLERSVVRRRYSEFLYMRNLIKGQHPTLIPPSLPPRSFFTNKSDSNFIENRRLGLEIFLKKLMEIPMYVSNRTVHLFVQSSYPMHKIAYMVGCRHSASDEIEPHLNLNHFFPEEDSMMQSYNLDVPDFDILGRLQGVSAHLPNSPSTLCTHCGLPKKHIKELHGSSFQSPRLRVPGTDLCEGHNLGGNIDLDFNSSTATSSNNTPTLQSENSLNYDSIHIPKKKVSFCSEVTVAQILCQEDD